MILELEKLSLTFRPKLYRAWTWKEAAARAVGRSSGPGDGRFVINAAKSIDLRIREGERVGIIGPNGAGKTSICRCIAGIYRPTGGQVRLRGNVRAIFDTALGMQPDLTGRENAWLMGHLIYPDEPRVAPLIEEALEFSGLGPALDMPFHLYSMGMQARLCLSLVSARPCDLLILDEVFEGADGEFRERVSRRVVKMIAGSGAVLFVSHGMDQIRRVCNRVVFLAGGEILFDGNVEEGIGFYESHLARLSP